MNLLTTAKGMAGGLMLATNTVVMVSLLVPFALAKLLLPFAAVRRPMDHVMNRVAEVWIGNNSAWIALVGRTRWDVAGVDGLAPRAWYLVSSNHRSWVDILVLQKVFTGRIPLLKFFLKRELIWVPVIGLAWWALDFPFMRRGRGGKAGAADIAATRRACEKFRLVPTSVINFLEGTRFTRAKHDAQRSPYRHLLKPRAGGTAIALATMGDRFDAALDITLVYPGRTPTFWDLLSGQVQAVIVRAQRRTIPPELVTDPDPSSPAYRGRVQAWVNEMWDEKDAQIEALIGSEPAPAAAPADRAGARARPR